MEFVVFDRPRNNVTLFGFKLVVERIERSDGGGIAIPCATASILSGEDALFEFGLDLLPRVEALLGARESPDEVRACRDGARDVCGDGLSDADVRVEMLDIDARDPTRDKPSPGLFRIQVTGMAAERVGVKITHRSGHFG
ncbi:uncharacterized protein EI90DRAFT_3290116 [Cantharellus anzutake]|uniref:uncharacterized protein n=1 Tax=Cantharellus anzutake TaxID=1750568 RepID=UPI001907C815|nr:uncharacterized protein EI90DRAFT_3290116 [Cantharellus anzutake]KAF8329378.1 hypothetical protein EI90DRAFT_3290116 [Cantharellus anzutake]